MIILVSAGFILFAAAFLLSGALLPSRREITGDRRDRYADVEGSRIRFRANDREGFPMIMLHGFGGDLSEWEPLAGVVECAKAISIDLIGFGLSEAPPITYDLETQRRYLLSFMDGMGIKKAVLVGSSMGSSIALWTAAFSPERVGGLVVFAPSAYPDSMRHPWPGNYFYRPNILNRAARLFVGTRLYNAAFPRSLGRQAFDVTASYNADFSQCLGSIHQPLLLVWSRGDRRVPFSYSERYRELLPHARFIEAPIQAGHGAAGSPTPGIIEGICGIVAQARAN